MPIRTHRGRAAVYRRLWGWPLRSPKHLFGALIVIILGATAVGFMLPTPPPADPRAASSAATDLNQSATQEAETSTSPAPPSFTVPDTTPSVPPLDPAGLAAAEAWAKAWTDHPPGMNKQQWLNRLRPRTTAEFLPQLESVALANVATAVTGPAKPVKSTAKSMTVRLPTNLGNIEIVLLNTPDGWRITSYDKAV